MKFLRSRVTFDFWLVVPLLAALFAGCFVPHFPIFDDWAILGNQFRNPGGPFSYQALFTPVNEHPIPVARLIYGLNGFGGSSQIRLMWLSILVASISFVLVCQLFLLRGPTQNSNGVRRGSYFGLALALGFFSFAQWESLFFGMVIHFYLYSFGTLLGVLGLRRRSLSLALVGVLVCSGTLASWPLYVLALSLGVLLSELNTQTKVLWWFSFFALSGVLKYVLPGGAAGVVSLLKNFADQPLSILAYAAVYLGGPLYMIAKDPWIAGWLGLLGACCVLMLFFSRQTARRSELSVLWIHLVLIAGVTALARIQFGVSHGAASRYVALSMPAWLALLTTLCQLKDPVKLRRLGFVLLGLLILASERGLSFFILKKLGDRVAAQLCFEELVQKNELNSNRLDPCFEGTTNSASEMREIASDLNLKF